MVTVFPGYGVALRPIALLAALLGVLCVAIAALPSPARAAGDCTRFASPTGDDDAPGTEGAPLRSPQALLDSLDPGQTGCLRGGSYSSPENILAPDRGGSAGAPLTLRSYPGERAKLIGIIDIPNGVDHITLSGLSIEGTGAGGANTIKIYSRGVVIEDSDITNAWRGRSCLMLGNVSGGGQAVAPIVRGNTFHECGSPSNDNHDHAIYAANVAGGEIVGNLFYNSAAYTVQLYPNAQGTYFAHNIVDGSAPSVRGGLVFGGDTDHASSNNVVEFNVIAHAATSAITSNWEGRTGTGNVARHNCVWGSGGEDISSPDGFAAVSNKVANPVFTSRAVRDYRLRSASPCRPLLQGLSAGTLDRRSVRRQRAALKRLSVTLRSLRVRSGFARASGRARRVRLPGRVREAGPRRARQGRRRLQGDPWAACRPLPGLGQGPRRPAPPHGLLEARPVPRLDPATIPAVRQPVPPRRA
jgi:hypothetical protein